MFHKKKVPPFKKFIKPILAVLVFALVLWLGFKAQSSPALQELASSGGYPGVFLFAFINGFNAFVPVLTTSFLPVWEASGLEPSIMIILISLAMTMADSVAFFIAKWGSLSVKPKERGLLHRLKKLRKKFDATPLIALFFWSIFAPLPNEVILIPMGIMNYKPIHILPIVLVGNFIFNTLTALGIASIFQAIG